MGSSIVLMLEAMKQDTFTDVDDYINAREKKSIIEWFSQYMHEEKRGAAMEEIVALMYELHMRENIDFYPVEEFRRVAIALAEQYCFDSNRFLEMLHSFRKLVYGE